MIATDATLITQIAFSAHSEATASYCRIYQGTASYNITAVDQATKRFFIAQNVPDKFLNDSKFTVSGSTGNDGIYTVNGDSTWTGAATQIYVDEALPSAVGNGAIGTIWTHCDTHHLMLTGAYFSLWSDTNDILYVGSASPFAFLGFRCKTAGSYGDFTFQYWNGAWTGLTPAHNGVAGFSQSGYIAWGIPSDWALTIVSGISAYWIRGSVDAVTTKAIAYNLLRSVTLNAPLHMLPVRATPAIGRDINGDTYRRDIPQQGTDRLTIDCTHIAASMANVHVLWDWYHYRTRLYIESGAHIVPIGTGAWATDAYAHAYKGRILSMPPGISTPHAMDTNLRYQIEIDVDEIETLTSRLGVAP